MGIYEKGLSLTEYVSVFPPPSQGRKSNFIRLPLVRPEETDGGLSPWEWGVRDVTKRTQS